MKADDGLLIGLHSSWNENTAMRHGVPLTAMRRFLEECLPGVMGVVGLEGLEVDVWKSLNGQEVGTESSVLDEQRLYGEWTLWIIS
ncbi:hypothetical protein EAF00_000138 [Botryotinia globosa]|nr:hypothetical protein EAF00_000138 [Botryotinia globosa]